MTDRQVAAAAPDSSFVLVMLGVPTARYREVWSSRPRIRGIVSLPSAAPMGLRLGRRSLGLGLDSLRVAVKARLRHPRSTYLATNPWIGVALRLLGARRLAVLGLYAEPGSRSWTALRKILGATRVVTTVSIEADAWRDCGGIASHVLYAAQFDYPDRLARYDGALRIFVGGSSDRDRAVIDRLEQEVLISRRSVELVVAVGGPPSTRRSTSGAVVHLPVLSQAEFGCQLAQADVVFLPLARGTRAAGHMVTVGALQVGTPVVTTPSAGMTGYVDGTYVVELEDGPDVLPQLLEHAERFRAAAADVREHWRATHDLERAADEILGQLA